ncbi:MAG: hypothetical protein V1781_08020 [Bacteroidota bacterium]
MTIEVLLLLLIFREMFIWQERLKVLPTLHQEDFKIRMVKILMLSL